jgi:uncharacterized phage protein gp47/JayE
VTTSVPQIQWTSTGVVLPTQAAILAGCIADINAAFGGNLNPALNTPQGQLASSFAAMIADCNQQIAYLANMVDPANAQGRFQDAIGNIYFMSRIPATGTVVQATCTGLNGTIIPLGATAIDINGNIYACTQSGTIGVSGNVTLQFTCQTTGAIACNIGNLNQIYQAIIGWESVTNATAGVIGNAVESRIAFEQRRQASVAINSIGMQQSIYAAVTSLAGVVDCYVYENNTSAPISVGVTSYSIAANSIYVAVVGGSSSQIANAIWLKKSLGCNYNGNTSVTVYDQSGYNYPFPSYAVKYNVPTNVPILFAIQIQNNPSLPASIVSMVQNAVIAAFTGNDGGTRARIGSQIVTGRFFAGVAATNANVNIYSILLGISTPTLSSVTMGIDQEPTVTAGNISVVIS